MPSFSPSFLLLIAGIVAFGGVVKGVAGFGYAIASTALLANVLEPSTAVVLMILPMLVANVGLLGQLRWRKIVSCLHRFWPYIVLTMVGTILGMVLLDRVPTGALTVGIGLFTLLYVAATQSWVSLPGEDRLVSYCFRPGSGVMAALGLISGFVFGVSNVAVQVVAYLDSLSLDRGTFIGVLAMILVGISGVRIGLAWG
ncbi:MAG: TSUP family transporter, partial [Halobacteriales archaeon]